MSRLLPRRGLAAALPAAALLASPVQVAGQDAVLLARVDDLVALLFEERTLLASLSGEDRAMAHAYLRRQAREGKPTRTDRLATAIAKMPARTPEGLRAKARAAAWNAGSDDTTLPRILIGDALLTSLLADLTGLPSTTKGARA